MAAPDAYGEDYEHPAPGRIDLAKECKLLAGVAMMPYKKRTAHPNNPRPRSTAAAEPLPTKLGAWIFVPFPDRC